MDIAGVSVYMKQSQLAQQVSLAVTRKVMDVSEQNSQLTIQMLEQSINPDLGKNIDIRV
jgi:hypothetical protein